MELRGELVRLRPLEKRDVPSLLAFAREPEIARWWPRVDAAYMRGKLGSADDFAVDHEGEVIGYAQVWEELDPEYRHAGIDLFLGREYQGRGLGADTVRTLARGTSSTTVVTIGSSSIRRRTTSAPSVRTNVSASSASACSGSRSSPADGTWRDGLLMDLLAEELE